MAESKALYVPLTTGWDMGERGKKWDVCSPLRWRRGRERVSPEPLDPLPQPTGASTTDLRLSGGGQARSLAEPQS